MMGAAVFSSHAVAYSFDPGNADEQGDGIKYFGAAKTKAGALLPDAQILFSNGMTSFLAITDAQGRYRIFLPKYFTEHFRITCFKEGFKSEKVMMRPGPRGPRQTVQADCTFQKQ
jgi:hypothetical protein